MKPINLRIAEELGVREQQVAAVISLLDGGATVPFVARYRKEATGELESGFAPPTCRMSLGQSSGQLPN